MSKSLNNTIAIKHEHGVSFGTVDWINGEKLQAQIAAKIARSAVVEMRMELTGWKQTVYAIVEVQAIAAGTGGEPPRYGLLILEMATLDAHRLTTWHADYLRGGTALDPTETVSEEMDNPFDAKRGAASWEETQVVLRRYEERRKRSSAAQQVDTFGLEDEEETSGQSTDFVIRGGELGTGTLGEDQSPNWLVELEKEAADRGGRNYEKPKTTRSGQPARAVAPRPAPATGRAPVKAAAPEPATPPAPEPVAPPAPPPRAECCPGLVWEQESGDRVKVSWESLKAYQAAWKAEFSKGWITPPKDASIPAEGVRLRLQVNLPDGQVLILKGTLTSDRVKINLNLSLKHKLTKAGCAD